MRTTEVAAAAEPATYGQTTWRMPAGATDLLLIRHGQSAPMPTRGYPLAANGHADPELSGLGREQADLLGARLADAGIEAIYVSTLVRTQQTAEPLAARTQLTPRIDPDLHEIHLGEWEGGEYRRRVEARDPQMLALAQARSWSAVPGAEGDEAFAGRVRAALTRIAQAHAGQRVAVVCHGGVIGQAIALATGALPMAFAHCDNASISQLAVHGEVWGVRRFNDSAHLGPAFSAQPVI